MKNIEDSGKILQICILQEHSDKLKNKYISKIDLKKQMAMGQKYKYGIV